MSSRISTCNSVSSDAGCRVRNIWIKNNNLCYSNLPTCFGSLGHIQGYHSDTT